MSDMLLMLLMISNRLSTDYISCEDLHSVMNVHIMQYVIGVLSLVSIFIRLINIPLVTFRSNVNWKFFLTVVTLDTATLAALIYIDYEQNMLPKVLQHNSNVYKFAIWTTICPYIFVAIYLAVMIVRKKCMRRADDSTVMRKNPIVHLVTSDQSEILTV
jgi:hypothetical protein